MLLFFWTYPPSSNPLIWHRQSSALPCGPVTLSQAFEHLIQRCFRSRFNSLAVVLSFGSGLPARKKPS